MTENLQRHPWFASFLVVSFLSGLIGICFGLFGMINSLNGYPTLVIGLFYATAGTFVVWGVIHSFKVCGPQLVRYYQVSEKDRLLCVICMLPGFAVGSSLFIFLFIVYLYFRSGQFTKDADEFGW